jgi:nitroimidazol reductase NimA-like FMN-containing flavoprotein (pyridoxamine 5'-phosphate oxidase superfamily)
VATLRADRSRVKERDFPRTTCSPRSAKLHGSSGSRLVKLLASGAPICVAATILDGLVLARSAPFHSMNYRSVVVLGRPRLVDEQEKLRALEAVVITSSPAAARMSARRARAS